MDFLQIVAIYVLLFFASVGLYFFGDSAILKKGMLGKLRTAVIKVFQTVVPKWPLELALRLVNYILYTRNQTMKVLFGILVIAGNITCILDVLPLLNKYEPEKNHTLIPILNVFINLYFFHKCCNDDPGEITPSNVEKYKAVYQYDGQLYIPNTKCRTCQFVKPARSKHCSICNRCVHRFDHHCIWTNNDVGGLNHKYFVLFLITMMFKCICGLYYCTKSLVLYTHHKKLFETTVLRPDGGMQPVTTSVVFQHLFIQFPRLVFIGTSLFFLIIMLGIFTVYHVNVVLTNRTTNERYKVSELESIKSENSNNNPGKKPKSKECLISTNIYDKGIMGNIYDTFWHRSIVTCMKVK